MNIDTPSKVSTTGSGLTVEGAACAVLDSLGLAVLVVDRDQVIRHRNAVATDWLPDGEQLGAVMVEARFLEPFGQVTVSSSEHDRLFVVETDVRGDQSSIAPSGFDLGAARGFGLLGGFRCCRGHFGDRDLLWRRGFSFF